MRRYIHTIDVVFALVLFCAFAMSLLLVLMTGARAYRGIRDNMEETYTGRTCLSYIATKLRHYDETGAVSVGELDGVPALCLAETSGDGAYVTYLYFYDGYICELFTDPSFVLTAEAGTRLMEAGGLTFSQVSEGLVVLSCTDVDGDSSQLMVSLRSGGGVEP